MQEGLELHLTPIPPRGSSRPCLSVAPMSPSFVDGETEGVEEDTTSSHRDQTDYRDAASSFSRKEQWTTEE